MKHHKKLRIIMISNMYPGPKHVFYGAFIRNIEHALINNGVSVSKIVITDRGKSILTKFFKYLDFYIKILTTDFSKYDLVHLSYPSHTFIPFLLRSIPDLFIVRLHGHDLIPKCIYSSCLFYFTKLAIKQAQLVVVPSKYFLNVLSTKLLPIHDSYIYPSGGIDTTQFYPTKNIQSKFTIGFVGWLVHGKGPDLLLDALSLLDSKIDFKSIFIGEGDQKESLINKASIHGLGKKVQFIGAINNHKLVTYYNQFSIFVFPTRELESFGNVAIEAMACGVPVVGSNQAGLTDYIVDGHNGFFFQPGNAQELALKIQQYHSLSESNKNLMKKAAINTAMRYEKHSLTRQFIKKLVSMPN